MKKLIWIVVAALLVGGVGYWMFSKSDGVNFGGNNDAYTTTLAGSSSNFVSLPRVQVYANSTTTDATATGDTAFLDGGFEITQAFDTEGYEWVNLQLAAVGGTATSTMFVKLQLYDGVDWADAHVSTTPAVLGSATSTRIEFTPRGFLFDPGTISTTPMRFPFYVYGSRQARLIMHGDDLTTDVTDGVQIWAKAIRIDPFQR